MQKSSSPSHAAKIDDLLASELEKSGLPALSAAAIKSGAVVAAGAIGVRKVGDPALVTLSDKFHIGSCTKAMTATLAAILVEQGKLRWDQTLEEVFPERVADMHSDYRKVTLELLLTHRAGAPANGQYFFLPLAFVQAVKRQFDEKSNGDDFVPEYPILAQRLAYFDGIVKGAPENKPGTTFSYSNAGYVIAGAILERVTGQAWEDLIQQRLFRSLGMRSAGFGSPSRPDAADQPWGHVFKNGKYEPRYGDNASALGPAGTVHCSIVDYMNFAGLHSSLGSRPKGLLRPESFERLHTPPSGSDYAFGWAVTQRPRAQGKALTHTGSNTRNYFWVWVAPKIDFALAVASNAAGENVPEALNRVASELVHRFT
jgi:CubicO group peptidase (beta-lactamase class C family)